MASNIEPFSLPPKGVFHFFDARFLSLQEYGILAGCAYITKKSERSEERWIKTIACKRSGKESPRIDNKEYRQRHRYTFKCECPFSVKAREQYDNT
jgi:hypothetical protein